MRQIITICVTFAQKNFYIQTLIKQLFTKYQIFKKLPQILHIHKNGNFLSMIGIFLDQLLPPYKFYGGDMIEIYFLKFYQLSTVKTKSFMLCFCLFVCFFFSFCCFTCPCYTVSSTTCGSTVVACFVWVHCLLTL